MSSLESLNCTFLKVDISTAADLFIVTFNMVILRTFQNCSEWNIFIKPISDLQYYEEERAKDTWVFLLVEKVRFVKIFSSGGTYFT